MSKEEEKLYPEIKEWLQNYLIDKYKGYTVETTYETSRRNLDVVLKSKGIICKEAIGLQIKIDIVAILKKGNDFKLVFVEVKDTNLTLKDLGQLGLKEPTDEQKDKIIEFIKSKLNMNDDINSNDIKNYVFMHYT